MEFFGSINAVYVVIGSSILGAAGALLGCFAVLRKQGLLGDALAHSALPGIVLGFLVMQVKFLPGLLFGALLSGLLGAFFIQVLVRKSKIKMDTAMASVLSVFFGIGVLLLSYVQRLPNASQSGLDSFMFGRAAALLKEDVIWMAVMFVVILVLVLLLWKELKLFVFDSDFARVLGFRRSILEGFIMGIFVLAILMSLQAVGVILTAALFITPAVAALLWTNRLWVAVFLSTVFGMSGGFVGAYISAIYENMPTGPVIVLATTAIFVFSFLFAPKKGVVSRIFRHWNNSMKVQMENVLGYFYRDVERGCDLWRLDDYRDRGYRRRILSMLWARGLVLVNNAEISLTKKGLKVAEAVVRRHRLWESYLVSELGVAEDHVHRDAHEIEHVLTPEMTKKLKKRLGNPKIDPHGKPIK